MKFKVIIMILVFLFILLSGCLVFGVIASHFPPPWDDTSAIIIPFFWGVIVANVFIYKLVKLIER